MAAGSNRSWIRLDLSRRAPIEICLSPTIVNQPIRKHAVFIN